MGKIFKQLKEIAGDNEVYVVGGWLRDMLLKRPNKDLDIAVKENPERLARKTAKTLKGSFVLLDRKNGIYRVVLKNNPEVAFIDFAKFRGRDIETDLKRRDFTVNALAAKITESGTGEITDPYGGIRDIKKRVLRMASHEAFSDDPLRALRAFRFAAQLGFHIEPATLRRIKKDSRLISRSAGERVREELFKILSTPDAASRIRQIERSGLLDTILPETLRMKKSARSFYFHPLGLWQHAMETLESLEYILPRIKNLFPQHYEKLSAHLNEAMSPGITKQSLLKFVALLHDMAKPDCAKRVGKRMRFLGHEEKGAKMISAVLKRMRMSSREVKTARCLVENHMRPINLGQSGSITERASFRLFRDIGSAVPELLLLSYADCRSYRRLKGRKVSELKKQEKAMKELISRYFRRKEKGELPKLIDGHIIMKRFKLEPGPLIGKLLNALREAQEIGSIKTQDEALLFIGKRLTRYKK